MPKLNCKYQLQIGLGDLEGAVEVKLPFTMEFDIKRDYFASANYGQIRVYNLSEQNRNNIRKDPLAGGNFRFVELKAGYGENLSTLLKGNISEAHSVREGNNYITNIQCFDAGFAFVNGFTSLQVPAGTLKKDIINKTADSLKQYNVEVGSIGKYSGKTGRGSSYSGSPVDILSDLTGGGVFIDNSRIHCLGDDEVIEADQIVISSETGLLGTPVLQETVIYIDMLFEPRLLIGQAVQLNSTTNKAFSGEYKVASIHHRGTISDAVGGSRITSVGLIAGKFVPVPGAT